MAKDGTESKNNLPTSNDNVVANEDLFSQLKNVKQGKIKSYLQLAEIYELGLGVRKDFEKAMNFRLKYLEEFRKVVPNNFDPILTPSSLCDAKIAILLTPVRYS